MLPGGHDSTSAPNNTTEQPSNFSFSFFSLCAQRLIKGFRSESESSKLAREVVLVYHNFPLAAPSRTLTGVPLGKEIYIYGIRDRAEEVKSNLNLLFFGFRFKWGRFSDKLAGFSRHRKANRRQGISPFGVWFCHYRGFVSTPIWASFSFLIFTQYSMSRVVSASSSSRLFCDSLPVSEMRGPFRLSNVLRRWILFTRSRSALSSLLRLPPILFVLKIYDASRSEGKYEPFASPYPARLFAVDVYAQSFRRRFLSSTYAV